MTQTPTKKAMTTEQRRTVYENLLRHTILENPYIPQTPMPKQARFLLTPHLEAFFGGAAGPGKSSALLMGALQYSMLPSYAAIIFRRSYTDLTLPGALMERAHEWLDGTDAKWSELDKTWSFPSGATLTFAYMSTEKDKYRYRSAEFQYIGFDELTDFTKTQYEYLFSRLRRGKGNPIMPRMRSASNPDGPGAAWVRDRFVNSATSPSRIFMPAVMTENIHLDQDAYMQSLNELDPVTRSQLLHGDWDVRHRGGLFDRDMYEIVEPLRADHSDRLDKVRYWDLAATPPSTKNPDPDWTRGAKLGLDHDGSVYILDIAGVRGTPASVENLIAATAIRDSKATRIGMEQEPGASGKSLTDHYARRVLGGYTFRPVRATGPKLVRAQRWSAASANGLIKVVRGAWNQDFFEEIEAFPAGVHDDQVDAVSGAFEMLGRQRWRAV